MAKRLSLYGIFTALCLVLGFVESLISFSAIVPGIKLGLANSIALLLVLKGDIKGAFLVNSVRIVLSAFLFATPSVLMYSLPAGLISLLISALISKCKFFGSVGISVTGAVTHNAVQLVCAMLFLGAGVVYYLPFLLLSALVGGVLVGILAGIINSKFKF